MFRPRSTHLLTSSLLLLTALLAGGCSDDETGPGQGSLTIAAAPTNSGDGQDGTVGEVLDDPLRVIVTRDGQPAGNVVVQWDANNEGTMAEDETVTDVQGIAENQWILGLGLGEQTAVASLEDAQGSPVQFTATASAPPPPPGLVVDILPSNQFSPAEVSVGLGQTVSWVWPDPEEEAELHNIVPDDNSTPSGSGPPRTGPATYSFTFTTAGTYRYYCAVHGAPGGVGMSGVVTVTDDLP